MPSAKPAAIPAPRLAPGAPRAAVVLNAGSGSHDHARDDAARGIVEAFAASGIAAHLEHGHGSAIGDLAARAARGDAPIVVAAGGDGTVSAVAAALVGTGKILGVLPRGTLNHFAKDLRIPIDLDAAVQVIAGGHTVAVDAGEVNGRIFINNSSIGLYPHIVRRRELGRRLGWGKWPAFAWAALRVLSRYPFLTVRLALDSGEEIVRHTPIVLIGNNAYTFEGFEIGSRARLDGGTLGLYTVRPTSRLGLIRLAFLAILKRLHRAEDFEERSVREVWIETRRAALHVAADGEVFDLRPPLHYRSRPGALRVLVPAESG
ncbi:MAG: diacylglycerol kinase family protein [Minicystis sp.]